MDRDTVLAGIDNLIADLVADLPAEIALPARVALLIVRDLVEAGHTDPVAALEGLRTQVRTNWLGGLKDKFGG